ncbi:MAG: substrate-binding domain-containing protein [Candidatus Dormibacteria bacterium]
MPEPRPRGRREPGPDALAAGRRLRLARLAAGLSQSQLAAACEVSRQALAGAETGVWSPSLAVALRLARALGTTVDQLFATDPSGRAVVASALVAGRTQGRARIVWVWDRWVAMPLQGDRAMLAGFIPAGGVLGGPGEPSHLWGTGHSLLVAGCDPALPLLAGPVAAAGEGWSLDWWSCGSEEARRLLDDGMVHAAAVHYPTPERGVRTRPPKLASVGFACWREGVAVRSDQQPPPRSVEEVLALGLRWVNREPGAQARHLLDQQLARLGVGGEAVPGYRSEAAGHFQVAGAVASGTADVGITTEPAALAYGLEFVPLSEEECVLLVERDRLETPELQLLLTVLAGPQLRRELDALPGYGADIAGAEL